MICDDMWLHAGVCGCMRVYVGVCGCTCLVSRWVLFAALLRPCRLTHIDYRLEVRTVSVVSCHFPIPIVCESVVN